MHSLPAAYIPMNFHKLGETLFLRVFPQDLDRARRIIAKNHGPRFGLPLPYVNLLLHNVVCSVLANQVSQGGVRVDWSILSLGLNEPGIRGGLAGAQERTGEQNTSGPDNEVFCARWQVAICSHLHGLRSRPAGAL